MEWNKRTVRDSIETEWRSMKLKSSRALLNVSFDSMSPSLANAQAPTQHSDLTELAFVHVFSSDLSDWSRCRFWHRLIYVEHKWEKRTKERARKSCFLVWHAVKLWQIITYLLIMSLCRWSRPNVKIGQYLAKIWTKVRGLFFAPPRRYNRIVVTFAILKRISLGGRP